MTLPGKCIVLWLYFLIQVVGSIDEIPSKYTAAVRLMKNHMVSKFSIKVNSCLKL